MKRPILTSSLSSAGWQNQRIKARSIATGVTLVQKSRTIKMVGSTISSKLISSSIASKFSCSTSDQTSPMTATSYYSSMTESQIVGISISGIAVLLIALGVFAFFRIKKLNKTVSSASEKKTPSDIELGPEPSDAVSLTDNTNEPREISENKLFSYPRTPPRIHNAAKRDSGNDWAWPYSNSHENIGLAISASSANSSPQSFASTRTIFKLPDNVAAAKMEKDNKSVSSRTTVFEEDILSGQSSNKLRKSDFYTLPPNPADAPVLLRLSMPQVDARSQKEGYCQQPVRIQKVPHDKQNILTSSEASADLPRNPGCSPFDRTHDVITAFPIPPTSRLPSVMSRGFSTNTDYGGLGNHQRSTCFLNPHRDRTRNPSKYPISFSVDRDSFRPISSFKSTYLWKNTPSNEENRHLPQEMKSPISNLRYPKLPHLSCKTTGSQLTEANVSQSLTKALLVKKPVDRAPMEPEDWRRGIQSSSTNMSCKVGHRRRGSLTARSSPSGVPAMHVVHETSGSSVDGYVASDGDIRDMRKLPKRESEGKRCFWDPKETCTTKRRQDIHLCMVK